MTKAKQKNLDPKIVVNEFDKRATERTGIYKILSGRYDLKTNKLFEKQCDVLIKKYLPKKSNTILDAGIGTGRLAKKLSNKCNQLTGIDFSHGMIELAKRNLKKRTNITLIQEDIIDKNFAPSKFDLAIICLVLKHNNNKHAGEIIKKLKRWCKQVLVIEHVAGGATGSDIAVIREKDWYINKFKPMTPIVTKKLNRGRDNIIFTIFEKA